MMRFSQPDRLSFFPTTKIGCGRIRLGLVVAIFLSVALPVSALAGTCDDVPPPTVRVTSPRQPVVQDRSFGVDELTRMMGSHGSMAEMGAYARTLGLTTVDYATSIQFTVQVRKPAFGSTCGYPTSITVVHGYAAPVKVFIANELRDGTCKYRSTLDHEMQHVRIHEGNLVRSRQVMEAAVRRAVAEYTPIYDSSTEAITARLNAVLSDAVDRAAKDAGNEAQRLNSLIDTPQSYRALAALCPGE